MPATIWTRLSDSSTPRAVVVSKFETRATRSTTMTIGTNEMNTGGVALEEPGHLHLDATCAATCLGILVKGHRKARNISTPGVQVSNRAFLGLGTACSPAGQPSRRASIVGWSASASFANPSTRAASMSRSTPVQSIPPLGGCGSYSMPS